MKWLLPQRNRVKARLGAGREIPCIKFDESSGLIYSETTTTIPTWDDRYWARDSRIVKAAGYVDEGVYEGYVKRLDAGRQKLERYQKRLDRVKNARIIGFKGSRSLQNAAIECILENTADITLEGIECLPISMVRRVWHAVVTRCSMSFEIWSIFSKVLRQNAEFLDLLRYHEQIEHPNCPLDIYAAPLTSISFDFITSLSITTAFPVPDLIKLSAIKNLGTLEIINTTGAGFLAVGDRLLRSWHMAAVEQGAFSVLRILRLWKHDGLTEKSLAYISSFPALGIYDVRGCSFSANSRMKTNLSGWRAILETNILEFLEISCLERAQILRTKLELERTTRLEPASERLWDGARVKRISRDKVHVFLAKKPVAPSLIDDTYESNASIGSGDPEKEQHKPRSKRSEASQKSRSVMTWDLSTYKSFARIGELRNDTDLSRAGVELSDQAIVGDELVASTPVVSLRLGGSPSWMQGPLRGREDGDNGYGWTDNPRLATSSLRGMAFVRIKIPSLDSAPVREEIEIDKSLPKDLVGGKLSSTQPPPSRREKSVVVKNKKRKLDDVLNSFF